VVIDPDLLDACPDLQAGQGMISLSRLHQASGSVLSVQVRLPSSDTVRNFFTNRPDYKVSPSFDLTMVIVRKGLTGFRAFGSAGASQC
jgi:hypothetical protein